MVSDAGRCPEAEKITFQNVWPLNLWGLVRLNSLNTPKSGAVCLVSSASLQIPFVQKECCFALDIYEFSVCLYVMVG